MRSNRLAAVALGVCCAGTLYGAYQILTEKISTGSVYPNYSSYLSEPLGASAVKETLSAGRSVEILQRPIDRTWLEPDQSVVFYLAPGIYGMSYFDPEEIRAIRDYVLDGGRVLIASAHWRSLKDFQIQTVPVHRSDTLPVLLPCRPVGELKSAAFADSAAVPGRLKLVSRWPQSDVLLAAGSHPILIRLRIGEGELLVCSEPYLFSNEGLFRNRSAGLLSWIVRDRPKVVIDEYHHGVIRREGVAFLFGKYHLEAFILTLAVIAGAGLWMIVPPLMPARPPKARAAQIQNTFDGFVNLLGRVISRADLIQVCSEKWMAAQRRRPSPELKSFVDAELARRPPESAVHARDICESYNRILKKVEEDKSHVI